MSVNSPRARMITELPTGTQVATYSKYEEAAAAVGALGDAGFPLSSVTIAGSDLHMVERVLGRLTPARVAASGAGQGLTFGLLMGLMSVFAFPAGGMAVPIIAVLVGMLGGIVFNVVMWAVSPRRKYFFGQSGMVASSYAILVTEQADMAFAVLSGSQGNVPPTFRKSPRLTERPVPKTEHRPQSDAQKDHVAKEESSEPKSRSTEPPKYGVRLDDSQKERDPENSEPHSQDK